MPLRTYQAAWNQLRDSPDHTIVIAATRPLHSRIFRGIAKEKDIDIVYKMLLAEDGRYARLRFCNRTASSFTLRLVISIGISDFKSYELPKY